jgi:hypothetical protein
MAAKMSIDLISARYLRFADEEARDRSPLYEAITRGVADDTEALRFLEGMSPEKQQPNLLLGAVRHLFGVLDDWPNFRSTLLGNTEAVRSVMMTHSTQTNEPGRCATLLPLLARLPEPLALVEVGASAGLCLLPDFYDYDFGGAHVRSPYDLDERPLFNCNASGATPLPTAMPKVVWRAGLDLSPLEATNPVDAAWLQTLVWPEQVDRAANLQKALQIAATHCVRVEKGNLLSDDLEELCVQAPKNATLVIFHTAVLSYVSGQADKVAFGRRAQSLATYWVSNEAPLVLPDIAASVNASGKRGQFLLSVNESPIAWTDPHGRAIDWIA